MRHAVLAFAVLCTAAAAQAEGRPDANARLAACKAAGETGKHRCFTSPQADGPVNLRYGWNVGKGHPSSNTDPPGHDKLLNGLDQCGWYHDRGAGRWNPRTKVCEGTFMCANSMFLNRCMTSYPPANPDEVKARKEALGKLVALKACVPALYKSYGVEWKKDAHGSFWLSDKAEKELAESFHHCKPGMATPGWPASPVVQAYWKQLTGK